jgi:hypothetical protein
MSIHAPNEALVPDRAGPARASRPISRTGQLPVQERRGLTSARIVAICQKVQIELMIAPAADLEQPGQPAWKQRPPQSPFRRRG